MPQNGFQPNLASTYQDVTPTLGQIEIAVSLATPMNDPGVHELRIGGGHAPDSRLRPAGPLKYRIELVKYFFGREVAACRF